MNTIRHWLAYIHFKYEMWRLRRSVHRFARSLRIGFIPVIISLREALSEFGESAPKLEEDEEEREQ